MQRIVLTISQLAETVVSVLFSLHLASSAMTFMTAVFGAASCYDIQLLPWPSVALIIR